MPSSSCSGPSPRFKRADHAGGDAGGVPVHPHDGAERLKPERMRQPPQEFVAAVMMDDRLGDDGAERGHARRQPRRNASAMEGKIGAAGPSCHSCLSSGRLVADGHSVSAVRSAMVRNVIEYARRFDGRDAVLPDCPRCARHHVERTWLGIERIALPLRRRRPCESGTCRVSPATGRIPGRNAACRGASRCRRRCRIRCRGPGRSGFGAAECLDLLDDG